MYVNADALGWFINLWENEPNKTEGYEPKEWAAKAFINTYNYSKGKAILPMGGFIIEEKELLDELKKQGFEIIKNGQEGTINFDPKKLSIKPFFKGEYSGKTAIFEVLAKKV